MFFDPRVALIESLNKTDNMSVADLNFDIKSQDFDIDIDKEDAMLNYNI